MVFTYLKRKDDIDGQAHYVAKSQERISNAGCLRRRTVQQMVITGVGRRG